MKKELILVVVPFLIATALIVVTFFVPDVTTTKRDQVLKVIMELKQADNELNELVLKSRFGIVSNYDSLVVAAKKMNERFNFLKTSMNTLSEGMSPALRQNMKSLEVSVITRLDALEKFKRHNAVLRNSAKYAPKVGKTLHEIVGGLGKYAQQTEMLERTNAAVFTYILDSDLESRQLISDNLSEINEFLDSIDELHANNNSIVFYEYISHLRILVEEKSTTDIYMNNALASQGALLYELENGVSKISGKSLYRKVVDNYFWLIYLVLFGFVSSVSVVLSKSRVSSKGVENDRVNDLLNKLELNSGEMSDHLSEFSQLIGKVAALDKRARSNSENLPPIKQYVSSIISQLRKGRSDNVVKLSQQLNKDSQECIAKIASELSG